MYQSNNLAVMDTETLGRWDDAVVLSVAVTVADLTKAYTFDQLVAERTFFVKLNVKEQAEAGRKVEKVTLDWWNDNTKWNSPSDAARKVSLIPAKDSEISMYKLTDAITVGCHRLGIDPQKIDWCDRNLFDLKKVQHIIEITCGQYDQVPWNYHSIFDVVSWLKGIGQMDRYAGVNPKDIPTMVYHDPRHDAALDWLRIQKTMQEFLNLEVK